MIDLGDELAGYGVPYNDGGLVPDNGYLPKGGHRRLADLQKTGFNVPPKRPAGGGFTDLARDDAALHGGVTIDWHLSEDTPNP